MKRILALSLLSLLSLLACTRESGGKLGSAAGEGGAAIAGAPSAGGQGGSTGALGGAAAGGEWVDTFDASGCEQPAVIENCEDGWCSIPPGWFVMGSPGNEWNQAPPA